MSTKSATLAEETVSPIGKTVIAMDKNEFLLYADARYWDVGMDERAGEEGTVILSNELGNTLEFPGGICYWYPHRK